MRRAAVTAALLAPTLGCVALWPQSSPSPSNSESAAVTCPEVSDRRASLVGVSFLARGPLEEAAKEGFVPVRYERDGCRVALEPVTDCRVRGRYAWSTKARSRQVVLRTPDELGARLALAAPALRQHLADAGALRVEERVVGAWIAPSGMQFDRGRLDGPGCGPVTHVITAMELGGYVVVAGPAVRLDQADDLFAQPAEGLTEISRSGDSDKCASGGPGRRPGCDHALAVRLAPVLEGTSAVESPMVGIPAGEFWMGAEVGPPEEEPRHRVFVDAFAIDRTEVTNAEFARCVAAGACKPAGEGPGCTRGKLDRDDHPVNCVSHDQARAFCRWSDKRLPTEAEWERAARGVDGRSYPWGEAWPPPAGAANLSDTSASARAPYWAAVPDFTDGFALTAPVGMFRAHASPDGVLDVVGNVQEWTEDLYDPRAYRSKGVRRNPKGPRRGSARVARGASFGHGRAAQARLTRRSPYGPATRSQHIGFRCAQDAAPGQAP